MTFLSTKNVHYILIQLMSKLMQTVTLVYLPLHFISLLSKQTQNKLSRTKTKYFPAKYYRIKIAAGYSFYA